jgi:hypothetical protein
MRLRKHLGKNKRKELQRETSKVTRVNHSEKNKETGVSFYEQLLRPYSFGKKLQSQTVIREKSFKALSYKKGLCKMLLKLTPLVNFTNILLAAFASKFSFQKITNLNKL